MNMKMNFSMDEIRLKVEEYIKKGSRAAGRPVLTAYYVLTADSTPESERTNIMIALVAIVFPAGKERLHLTHSLKFAVAFTIFCSLPLHI